MGYIVFHVPHSSLKIPNFFWNVCLKNREYINYSNRFLCDYLTDKLVPKGRNKVVFKYSRIFCDVEKFADVSKEIMSKRGMGVIYTKDCDSVITNIDKKYRNKVIKSYYKKHHDKLDKVISNIMNKYNRCIIIDLHSFSDDMVFKLFGYNDNKDICIGTNPLFTDKKIIDFTVKHFEKYGYSVSINTPYSGTIVPNKYINKKVPQIKSIMIEINKRIFKENKQGFYRLKECINDYCNKIELL